MAEVRRLFPLLQHGVGVYVARGARGWEVRSPGNVHTDAGEKVLSCHRLLEVALDRCVWHSGTRFAYVKGDEHGTCWDSQTRTFVSWDTALEAVSQIINQRKSHA